MGKGVLLERKGRTGIVLTPQGEFKRVQIKNDSGKVGDEIMFTDHSTATPWAKWGVAAAAALMMAAAPFGYQSWALAQPVAVVTVDINPSVELTLNKQDTVIGVKGVNADGEQVLKDVDWKGQDLTNVIQQVTAEAIDEEKLDPADEAGAVVVAVAPAKDEELPTEVADSIRDDAAEAVSDVLDDEAKADNESRKAHVTVLEATAAERQAAAEAGLTPGKYLIWKQIQEKLPEVQAADLLEMGPGKLLHSLGVNPSEIFSAAESRHHGKSNRKLETETTAPETDEQQGTQVPEQVKPGNGNGNGNGNRPAQAAQPAQPGNTNPGENRGKSDEKGINAKATLPTLPDNSDQGRSRGQGN